MFLLPGQYINFNLILTVGAPSLKRGVSTHTSQYTACSVHLCTQKQTLRNGRSPPHACPGSPSGLSQMGYFFQMSASDTCICHHALIREPGFEKLNLFLAVFCLQLQTSLPISPSLSSSFLFSFIICFLCSL